LQRSSPSRAKDVEGIELDLVVVLPAVQPVEVGDAVNANERGLAIKDELLCPYATSGVDDQRIAAGPIVAVAGEQADAVAIARDDQPEAVLFYLVQPVRVRRDFCPASRDTRGVE